MINGTVKVYPDSMAFLPYGRAVALGYFDGLHQGHTEIIKKMVRTARGKGLVAAVQTFVNFPKNDGRLMTDINDRLEILSDMGVEELIILDYEKVRDMAPEDFVRDMLIQRMGAAAVFTGEDYRFGKDAGGDTELLRSMCEKAEIDYKIIPDKTDDTSGRRIASTWLRECIESGDMDLYTDLCGGRPFSYGGQVIRGRQLGRKLGFPTVNVLIPETKAIVKRGVYVSRIRLGNRVLYGVTNVGRRPTVESEGADIAETFIFDFDENIYGARIRVELLHFLRSETRFASEEDLRLAVEANKAEAAAYISENFN